MASRPGKAWVLPLAVLPLVACKPKAKSDSPERDVRSWTIAEIEAELVHNDQVLAHEGIMVAAATPTVTPPQPGEPAGPVAEEGPALTGEEPPPGEDDGGATAEPPQPEPAPTAAMPEPALQPEMVTSASPGEARNERRASRRLAARRDGETRCERVCGLAEATCELEAQICELAARHPDEPRYAQACLRAEQQCKAASEACQRCED